MTTYNDEVACSCCGKKILPNDAEPMFRLPDDVHRNMKYPLPEESYVGDDLVFYESRYYIRGLLPFDVQGRENNFSVGIWAELNSVDFKSYLDNYSSLEKIEFVGQLANTLPNYPDDQKLLVKIVTQGVHNRPQFFIMDQATELGKVQALGLQEHDLIDFFNSSK